MGLPKKVLYIEQEFAWGVQTTRFNFIIAFERKYDAFDIILRFE